jgi:hypothetical protein
MSTKTLRKRIALVAVVALGAGVLATSPATALDNAAVGTTTNAVTAASVLNIATNPSITGDAVLSALGSGVDSASLGLLANSTLQTTASLTSTATMRADGEIVFYTTGVIDQASTFVVEGATISGHVVKDGNVNYNSARNSLVAVDGEAALIINLAVTPNAGVTSFTVSEYQSATLTVADGATEISNASAIQAGTTSKGTLIQRYFVTVATTSASGVYSAADSFVQVQASNALAAPTTNTDGAPTASATYPTGSASVIGNSAASVGLVSFDLRDAYGVSLSGAGALVVSATNGAGVSLKNTTDGTYGAAASVTLLTAVSNFASGTVTVARPSAMANKGFSTTLTISWNGAVVGTKSITYLGEVASMVVTPRRIGLMTTSTTNNVDAFRVTYADSNGTSLIGLAAPATATAVSTTLTNAVTGATIGTAATATSAALGTLTCGVGASAYLGGGTAKLQLQHVNTLSGTTVKSNVFDATCQGSAYTYTAGFDKTTYTPGSLATLTITFKDRDGDLANGYDVVGTTASLIVIAGAPSATAVTIPADQDTPSSGTGLQGVKTYQFIVGSTEGDFQAVVSVPLVNARNTSSQANQTVAYSVKASSSGVTNADVLKAIVSLIASINKQIAALQKALLKK